MSSMKFNSQICTSRSQSERLLALGLKKETADMAIISHPRKDIEWKLPITEVSATTKYIPAWSLHRLLEMCTIGMRVPSMRLYVKDVYDNVIGYIEELIRLKSFSKEYLEE